MVTQDVQALVREGLALQQAGNLAGASHAHARARALAPQSFEAWHHGGMIALLLGRADEAAVLLQRAVELSPRSIPSALGLGVAQVARGDATAAEKILRAVVAQQPKLADAWHYLALAIETQGRLDEALDARQRVTTLNPKFAPGWCALGASLAARGRSAEALRCFTKALQLSPTDVQSRLGRAVALFRGHRVVEAAAEYEAVLRVDPMRHDARSFRLMALNSLSGVSREQVFEEHRAYGRAVGAAIRPAAPVNPDPDRRLKVGWVSPDFREHSVAYFIEPLLRHLDSGAFEHVLYHDSPQEDQVSARLKGLTSLWRNLSGRTDEMAEVVIQQDAPDILIDLAGHSGASRLRLFARRQAPVQLTYLGYPNTTGVAAMDFRFVDGFTDPTPEADSFATERLVRFAPAMWAYQPPAVAPAPLRLGLESSPCVTFAAFNNFTKATDETLRCWGEILGQVPGARLLIKAEGLGDAAVRDPVLQRLRRAGLPLDRTELLPRTPDTLSHLELYQRVDLALDTFPYHGTTTTCEALWMGVPVITFAGDRHAARVGVSLLNAVGHPEWIAATSQDYVRLAADLAADVAGVRQRRAALRADVQRSALLDHAAQAARFGAALRNCWRSVVPVAVPVEPSLQPIVV